MKLNEGIKEYSVVVDKYQVYFKCKFDPYSDEVILFIHGLACSSDSFRHAFEGNHFPDKSLLALDLIGFGKSSKPGNFSYAMEDQARLIQKLLSILPQWNIHIVAHSMGGAIALLFEPDIFSRVKSFANIEGNLINDDCGILSRGIISVSYEDYTNNLFKKHLVEFKSHHQLHFTETTPAAIYKSAVSLVEWSDSGILLNKFAALDCKKSYFFGEENKNMPVLGKLNFVQKFMIHNCGHGMSIENPKEFYSTFALFINSK